MRVTSARALASALLLRVAPHHLWRYRAAAWTPPGSERELTLIPHLCLPRTAAIDVGAAAGLYTIHMLGYAEACYAFEPQPAQASVLRQLFAHASPPVYIEEVALSDRAGTIEMRIPECDRGRSTIEAANDVESIGAVQRVTVRTARLDDYDFGPVGCIKIDVEGHEEAVLRGGVALLDACSPSLLIECEERHNPGALYRLQRFLTLRQYCGYFLHEGRLRPLDQFDHGLWQCANTEIRGHASYINNFIFVHERRLDRVRCFLA